MLAWLLELIGWLGSPQSVATEGETGCPVHPGLAGSSQVLQIRLERWGVEQTFRVLRAWLESGLDSSLYPT